MLRRLKLSLLHAARAVGAFRLVGESAWRQRQLLILCYHGISIEDEHVWAPGLYMSQDAFAARLALLKRARCVVLPLDEAIRRLYDGTLPRRSVAITFDDGNHDFHARAWPALDAAGFPATVYLTTYYCERNLPIFPLAISYLMWKRQGMVVPLHFESIGPLTVDTRSSDARKRSQDMIVLRAQEAALSATDKDRLARALADALGADYDHMTRRRLLHIMNAGEVRELAHAGVDFQLHTHRHRSPLDQPSYAAEISENRRRIAQYAGRSPEHFCYPSGVAMSQFGRWLDHEGVRSATTCEPGLARRTSDRFHLPRLLDHSDMTEVEFEAWLAGVGAVLPHRRVGFHPVDREGRLIIPRGTDTTAVAEPEGAGEAVHSLRS